MNNQSEKQNIQAEEKDYSALEFVKQQDKKKRKRNSALLLIFNLLVIAVIVVVEVTSNRQSVDISTVLAAWKKNWYFLIALFALVAFYYACLTAKISTLIKGVTGRARRKLSFSTAVLGKYYDNVTPFGSGGQPFQMFNLGRKLDVGLATSVPIADFIVNQLMFTLMAIAVFIINPAVMDGNEFLRIAAYVGAGFYAVVPIAVIVFSVFPGVIRSLAKFFCKAGYKLRLVKDLDGAILKATGGVQKYSDSLVSVGKKKGNLVCNAVISAIAWIALNSMPYLVLRSCGVNADYFNTVCMSFFVYAAITVVPTPGNAGAAEGAFYVIFQSLSGGFLFWGTMLWRFCVYYFSLISGLSVTVYQYFKANKKEKAILSSVAEAAVDECVTTECDAKKERRTEE